MGNSPLVFSDAEYFKGTIRAIQALNLFDRVTIAVILKVPFGSVSRVISQLENEGYIVPASHKSFSWKMVRQNPDLNGFRLNYSKKDGKVPTSGELTSVTYHKSGTWDDLMKRWSHFLKSRKGY